MGGKSTTKPAYGFQQGLEAGEYGRQLFQETAPYRESYYDEWSQLMGGEMPYEQMFETMYGAGKAPMEAQYGQARQNVLETIPEGGRLEESLTGIETARAQGLEGMIAGYLNDQLSKMYGTAFGMPQIGLGAMGTAGQMGAQVGSAQAQATGSMCCFNFLEAEGEIYSTVRRYRDDHYPRNGLVGRGYRLSAQYLVPLMQKYDKFKTLIRLTMTKPIRSYADWYYGYNRYGFISWPLAKAWVNSWRLLGMGGR